MGKGDLPKIARQSALIPLYGCEHQSLGRGKATLKKTRGQSLARKGEESHPPTRGKARHFRSIWEGGVSGRKPSSLLRKFPFLAPKRVVGRGGRGRKWIGILFVHYSMPKSLGEGGKRMIRERGGEGSTPELALLPFEKGVCTSLPVCGRDFLCRWEEES